MNQPNRAYSSTAARDVQATAGPLDWGDKCFLCSNSINIDTPPVEPREFYVSPKTGKMLLCHSACIDIMNRNGGTPADFHRSREAAGVVATPGPPPEEIKPPTKEQGAAWLHFDKVADYNAYVKAKDIDSSVKITVGTTVLQAGE